jgi:hypothetical protein
MPLAEQAEEQDRAKDPKRYNSGRTRRAGACDAHAVNEVACEKTKPGNLSSEWQISGSGSSSTYSGDDARNERRRCQESRDGESDGPEYEPTRHCRRL